MARTGVMMIVYSYVALLATTTLIITRSVTIFNLNPWVVVDGFIIRQGRGRYRSVKAPTWPSSSSSSSCLICHASSGNNDDNNTDKQDKLTNAERERREEDKRRKNRKGDVVIGSTSAKLGAQDYPLRPDRTQEEWLYQASAVEKRVYQLTEDGLEALKSLRLEDADKAFDEVFQLKPEAYLWQSGIVKFYLGDLKSAATILTRNAKLFEQNPIMGPATEERIWRDACQLKFLSSLPTAERKQILKSPTDSPDGIKSIFPQIIDDEEDDNEDQADDEDNEDDLLFSSGETRKVFRLARDLFSSSVESNPSGEAFARGQLLSIGGSFDDVVETSNTPIQPDIKMRKLTAWFFLGLHYDAIGERDDAIKCMKMAIHFSTNTNVSSDIMKTLPLLHMSVRDYFDDDDFDEDPLKGGLDDGKDGNENPTSGSSSRKDRSSSSSTKGSPRDPRRPLFLDEYETDPVLEDTVMDGLSKMNMVELRDALRSRGLKIRGSKQELIDRLFYSMMDDSGYSGTGFAP